MQRKFPFTLAEFNSIYSRVPRLCVDLIIQNEKGIILTLRQKHGWKGMWHLPGGTVYYQESIENAVKRVAKEEIGIDVEIIKFVQYTEFVGEKDAVVGHGVSLLFICRPLSTKFELDGHTSAISFFSTLPENIISFQRQVLLSAIPDLK